MYLLLQSVSFSHSQGPCPRGKVVSSLEFGGKPWLKLNWSCELAGLSDLVRNGPKLPLLGVVIFIAAGNRLLI